nr:hypothetical protein [Tanacetum cinerariifolium]
SAKLVEDDKEDEVEDDKDQEEEEEDDNDEKEQDDNNGLDDETWIPKKEATSSSRRWKKKKVVKRGDSLDCNGFKYLCFVILIMSLDLTFKCYEIFISRHLLDYDSS